MGAPYLAFRQPGRWHGVGRTENPHCTRKGGSPSRPLWPMLRHNRPVPAIHFPSFLER